MADVAGVNEDSIVSSDLFLYNRQKGTILGCNCEFMSAPRLDDIMCAYSCMKAHIAAEWSDSIALRFVPFLIMKESVVQQSKGADSTFCQIFLIESVLCMGISGEDMIPGIFRSFMLSADNAHGVHLIIWKRQTLLTDLI